jgi:hypothetical protein
MITIDKQKLDKLLASLKERQETIENMSVVLTEMLAKAFVARARKRLMAYTGQKRYSYYIRAVQNDKKSWSVVIKSPAYDPYIMYFFEYGTGFVGKQSAQNPDKPTWWRYTINRGAPWYGKLDFGMGQVEGWFYNYKENAFITQDDYEGIQKNGKQVVFTRGIKPVMYIYKTKSEISDILKKYYGKNKLKITYKQLKKELNRMIRSEIA